jgi:hypothetical protein
MTEINVKLDNETQISGFAIAIGKAIEEYILKVVNDTVERSKQLESKILNYYTLTKDENFKDYFDIREVEPQEGVVVEEPKEEGKIINMKPKKSKNGK